jgi:hypothetical protein
MLQISTMDIKELDHVSRAELRELWQREFAEKAPHPSAVTFLPWGLPMFGTVLATLKLGGCRNGRFRWQW